MEFTLRLKFDSWIDITNYNRARNVRIIKKRTNRDNKYESDILQFNIFEEEVDLIDKIRKYNGPILVSVYRGNDLHFYGTLKDKKELKIHYSFTEYKKLEAYDFVKGLDVKNTTYWNFENTSLANICKALCDHVGLASFFPPEMNKIKDHFFVTDQKSSILKILNNFLYEYGFVLRAHYFGGTPVVSVFSYRHRQNQPVTTITEKDITGEVEHKTDEKKQIKIFKTNYRIIRRRENFLLFADAINEPIWIQAGDFWPEEGDSKEEFQEYTIFHKDNFETSPLWFDPNSKMNWGTITKNSQVIYAENQRVSYYPFTTLDDIYIYLEEHHPDKSRIVLAKKVNRIYLGSEYRVVDQTPIRRTCSGNEKIKIKSYQYTREFFPTQKEAQEAALVTDKETDCTGQPYTTFEPVFESRTARKAGNAGRFSNLRITGDAWISVGNGTAYSSVFTKVDDENLVDEQSREYTINNITAGDSVDSLGRPITVMAYQFQDTPINFNVLEGWHILTENGTYAKISNYIGDTSWTDRWGFSYSNKDRNGVVEFQYVEGLFPHTWEDITKYGVSSSYTYRETPCTQNITGRLTAYSAPVIYDSFAEARANSQIDSDFQAFCSIPAGDSVGVARVPISASPVQTTATLRYPKPLLDKRGTKAIFIPPGERIKEQVEESSFLYNHQDASDFVQGILNDIRVGNGTVKYRGEAATHPDIGEYVDLDLPKYRFNNERYVVNKYTIFLDQKNNPKVEVELKRTKAWVPDVEYPDLIEFFPESANITYPEPVEENLYAYGNANGVFPLDLPKNTVPYGNSQSTNNINWKQIPNQNYNRQNREVTE